MSDDIINLLLVGVTGAGKTTIINALPSILKHSSFSSLTSEKMEVLQRINFKIFEEESYDEIDINAEPTISIEKPNDFEPDSSIPSVVTQFATSYTFTYDGQRYRIIDTPGVGDVRGIEQDKANVEKLMNYLANFEFIHAIVMIIGQEAARATTTFKFIMNQVLLQLHESAINNFLFCFTKCPTQNSIAGQVSLTNEYFAKREIDIVLNNENAFYVDNIWVRSAVLLEKKISQEPNALEQSEEQFVHSRKMFLRMLQTAKTLKAHDVMNSICINSIRNILISTVQPRASLLLSISKSIEDLKDMQNRITQGDSQTMAIQRQLKELLDDKNNYEIHPQIVCDHCMDNDSKQPLVCHYDCRLDEMKENPKHKLLSCIKFKNGRNCSVCHCAYDKHRYVRLRLENQKIKEKRNEKLNVDQSTKTYAETIKQLETTMKCHKEEQDFLTKANPLFALYLEKNSIVSTNDEYEEYIKMLEETNKNGKEENLAKVRRILQDHKTIKEDIKKAMEENKKSQPKLTSDYIMQLIEDMKNLSYCGAILKQILDQDETMRQQKNHHDVDINSMIS